MKIKITKWVNRLGNNFIQLLYVLFLAFHLNYNVYIPEHKLFNKTFIKINDKDENEELDVEFISLKGFRLRYIFKKFKISEKNFYNKEIFLKVINILKDLFIIKADNILLNNYLVIHIRSGDIFKKKIRTNYKPPPLAYYEEIIEKTNYENIIIVCEDDRNPVLYKLIEKYKNIKWKKNTLEEDIKIILSAKNIVTSVGTFIPSLLLLSENVNKLYLSSNPRKLKEYLLLLDNLEHIYFNYNDYYRKIKKWKALNHQKKFLINYKKN